MLGRFRKKFYFNFLTGEMLEEKLTLFAVLKGIFIFACELIQMVIRGKPKKPLRTINMENKTVIITGGGSGIGKEVALDLAQRGARVILACLFMDEAKKAQEEIIKESGNEEVIVKYLDVSSMKSVRRFASDILRTEKRLDILINNAGVGGTLGFTEEGNVKVLATNYLGPFLLTHLLTELLVKSSPSKVINVSSCLHMMPKELDLEMFSLDVCMSYAYSKLYLLMFTIDLAKKLEGTGVTVNALHPGVVNTSIYNLKPEWLTLVFRPILRLFKSPKDGAETYIYLSVADDAKNVTGKYFVDCKEEPNVNKLALDPKARQQLWRRTEEAVRLLPEETIERCLSAKRDSTKTKYQNIISAYTAVAQCDS